MGFEAVAIQGGPNNWSVTATGAAAATVTATKSAGAAGVAHVARRVQATYTSANAATTQTALILLDGTTVLAQYVLTVAANTAGSAGTIMLFDIDNVHLVGTAATLMSWSTAALNGAVAAALPTSVSGALNIIGYDLP